MSIKPDIISVTNTCSDILFRNVCPQLRSKDIGNLLPTCKAVEECFKEYFKEDLKGLNNFKERALTNSVMCATGEETPGLLTVYFKKNNTIGLKVLIKSERLNTIKNKHLNLTPSLSDAIKDNRKEVIETFINFASPVFLGLTFAEVALNGHQGIVEILRNSKRFAEIGTIALGLAFIASASKGHQGIVEILRNSERFTEIAALGLAFIEAAKNGHQSIIGILMNSERFAEIAIAILGSAFTRAAENGHQSIVEIFKNSERFTEIGPIALGLAFINAASKGHQGVVEILMNSGRFIEISTADLLSAFTGAVENGHQGIVEILKNSERTKTVSYRLQSISQAIVKAIVRLTHWFNFT